MQLAEAVPEKKSQEKQLRSGHCGKAASGRVAAPKLNTSGDVMKLIYALHFKKLEKALGLPVRGKC